MLNLLSFNSKWENILKRIYFLFLLFSFLTTYTYANDNDVSFWVGTGIGLFTFPNLNGVTQAYGDLNLRCNNLLFQGRIVSIVDKTTRPHETPDQIGDAGLLFGFLNDFTPYLRASISGGLSFVYCAKSKIIPNSFVFNGTDTSPARSTDSYRSLGIPIDVQLMVLFSKYFGIGISALANLNEPASYAGCAITLKFGVFK
jgi:hypothetical protein